MVVGGGYAGLWTAWHLLERRPGVRVVVLEAERCGFGPSGRNGGFVNSLWYSLPRLSRAFGPEGALALARASGESVDAIGAWCRGQGVNAGFRRAAHLIASSAPAHDAAPRRAVAAAAQAGAGDECLEASQEQVQAICRSPALRGGALLPRSATVQPARLALGLAARVAESGARVHEHSRVRALRVEPSGGVTAETAGGRVRARAAVLAVNAAAAAMPPLRGRLTVASSHVLATAPVPDVIEELGWTGGQAISDARVLLHYFRTTPDGRIVFGWAGGRMAYGARLRGRVEVDPQVIAQVRRDLVRVLPGLAGRRIAHAWGGPVDVSPTHIPMLGSFGRGRVHYVVGFTGNGVGPAHLAGRVLASLALDLRDEVTRLPFVDAPGRRVPPEPLRWAGGTLVRRALLRRERLEEDGEAVDRATDAVAGLPHRLGISLVR